MTTPKPKRSHKRKPAAPKPKPPEEVVAETPIVTGEVQVEETAPPMMTFDDARNRLMGIVNSARTEGLASVTSRGFAALEGFFGGLAGDKAKKPSKKE